MREYLVSFSQNKKLSRIVSNNEIINNMSLQSYLENLQREYNATFVELKVDRARGDRRILPCDTSRYGVLSCHKGGKYQSQRPSFETHSERLSVPPKYPLRSRDYGRHTEVSQMERDLAVFNMTLPKKHRWKKLQDYTILHWKYGISLFLISYLACIDATKT